MKSLEFAPETDAQSAFLPTLLGTRRGPESDISDVADKVFAGGRITDEEALRLFHHPNLGDLALLADFVRQKKNPGRTVTYVVGRNVNYTNVCWVRCSFCNFYRVPGHEEGYTLPQEEVLALEEAKAVLEGEALAGPDFLGDVGEVFGAFQ